MRLHLYIAMARKLTWKFSSGAVTDSLRYTREKTINSILKITYLEIYRAYFTFIQQWSTLTNISSINLYLLRYLFFIVTVLVTVTN